MMQRDKWLKAALPHSNYQVYVVIEGLLVPDAGFGLYAFPGDGYAERVKPGFLRDTEIFVITVPKIGGPFGVGSARYARSAVRMIGARPLAPIRILRRSFDLAAVRYITLQSNRVPLEIALTEGMDLDLFISANQLKGDDILLLPAGRRVAVYL